MVATPENARGGADAAAEVFGRECRPPGQGGRDEVQQFVDILLPIAAAAERRTRESDLVNFLGSHPSIIAGPAVARRVPTGG